MAPRLGLPEDPAHRLRAGGTARAEAPLEGGTIMGNTRRALLVLVALFTVVGLVAVPAAAQPKPNIILIMGDDVGWFNVGAYHQGMMASRTPNLDRLAAEGMRFTDYYAEASCTAGRANFITGQLPIRTGLTTVG